MFRSAICCIAKDEDNYLKEWCEYHLKMGFDRIYLYQNEWRYTRGDITDNRVEFIPFDIKQPQMPCYNGFINQHYKDYDFCFFLDCDEFFVLKNGINLQEYFERVKDVPNLYVNWRIFGDNGMLCVEGDDYSQLKRFTKCENKLHRLGKNILNTRIIGNSILFNNPHILVLNQPQVQVPTEIYDANGDRFPFFPPWDRSNPRDEIAEINHYRNKTYQERLERNGPGKDDVYWKNNPYHSMDFFNKSFDEYNMNDIENTLARDFMYREEK